MKYQTKGYWLFDRNDIIIRRNEAIISARTGSMVIQSFKEELRFGRVAGPWAIYKWVEQK